MWALLLIANVVACGDDLTTIPLDARVDASLDSSLVDRVDDGSVDAQTDAEVAAWRSETSTNLPLQEIAAVTLDDQIYVFGGFESDGGGFPNVVATVQIYNTSTQSWSAGPALPGPRHHIMVTTDGANIYAIGGMSNRSFDLVNTAWVLRPGEESWESLQSLPEPRAAGVAGVICDKIYVAAGQGRGGRLADSTLVFDLSLGTWGTEAGIAEPREHTYGFVHDDELWVVGGRMNSLSSNSTRVEIFSPVSGQWRDGPPLRTARGGHGVALLDGVAYAIGGEQRDRALTDAERLVIGPGATWEPIDPLPTPRHGHAQAAAAGKIFVIGGADRPIFAAVNKVDSFQPR
ncbi:MAG: hypothetical protein AAGF12_18180 [Myxococcota bacterium]